MTNTEKKTISFSSYTEFREWLYKVKLCLVFLVPTPEGLTVIMWDSAGDSQVVQKVADYDYDRECQAVIEAAERLLQKSFKVFPWG